MSIVVLVSPGLDPRTSPPERATGGRADTVADYSLPLVALGRYDLGAVRLATALGARRGEPVIAVSLGAAGADAALRRAIARGADSAHRVDVDDPESLDSAATARLLSTAVRSLGPVDAVVLGARGGTFETGALPGWLAHELAIPLVADLAAGAVDAVPAGAVVVSVRSLPSSEWPLPGARDVLRAQAARTAVIAPGAELATLRSSSVVASGVTVVDPSRGRTVRRDEPLPELAAGVARLVLTQESDE